MKMKKEKQQKKKKRGKTLIISQIITIKR